MEKSRVDRVPWHIWLVVILTIFAACHAQTQQQQQTQRREVVKIGNKYYDRNEYTRYYYGNYYYRMFYHAFGTWYRNTLAKMATACPRPTTQPATTQPPTTQPSTTQASTTLPPTTQPSTTQPLNETQCTCTSYTAMENTTYPANLTSTTIAPNTTQTTIPTPVIGPRIPLDLYPVEYTLVLRPLFGNKIFEGYVRILMTCVNKTDKVYLHMKGLTIDESSVVFVGDDPTPSIKNHTIDPKMDFIIYELTAELIEGRQYFIEMNYTGDLQINQKGFLHGYFWKSAAEKAYFAATFSKPTFARWIYPCFDEPAIKANYRVTLERTTLESTKSVAATVIVDRQTRPADFVAETFNITIPMSTYLLGVMVAENLTSTEFIVNGIITSISGRPATWSQATYGLTECTRLLTLFMNDIFVKNFPFQKLDVYISRQLLDDGIENGALLLFRETSFLYEESVMPVSQKQQVAGLVAQKMSQQWFGADVGLAWWDDLWLYEGFATYMKYFAADFLNPAWEMADQFVPDILYPAFDKDGFRASHPVYMPVDNSNEIPKSFTTLSYTKSAALIRMMHHFLGDNAFKNGLNNYLTKYEHGSATHNDFWKAMPDITQADGNVTDVQAIMDTWVYQTGYPLILVNHNATALFFTRLDAYRSDLPSSAPVIDSGKSWNVPITYTHSAELNFDKTHSDVKWFKGSDAQLTVEDTSLPTSSLSWYIVNIQQHGYYRVVYEQTNNLNQLRNQFGVNRSAIHPINRAQLVTDTFFLAINDYSNHLPLAVSFLASMRDERHYVPLKAAFQVLDYLDKLLSDSYIIYESFTSYAKNILIEIFNDIGMNKTISTDADGLKTELVTKYACKFGLDLCVQESIRLFSEWMTNPVNNTIDGNLKEAVYCTAIREGGSSEWEFLRSKLAEANFEGPEAVIMLKSLACTRRPDLLDGYVTTVLYNSETIGTWQTALAGFVALTENPNAKCLSWAIFESEYEREFFKGIRGKIGAMETALGSLARSFTTIYDITKLSAFQKTRADWGDDERALQQALVTAYKNVDFLSRKKTVLKQLLDA